MTADCTTVCMCVCSSIGHTQLYSAQAIVTKHNLYFYNFFTEMVKCIYGNIIIHTIYVYQNNDQQ